jgi:hypothetical protein
MHSWLNASRYTSSIDTDAVTKFWYNDGRMKFPKEVCYDQT